MSTSFYKLIVIIVVAVILFKPKDFISILYNLGTFIRRVKKFLTNTQSELETLSNLGSLDDFVITNKPNTEIDNQPAITEYSVQSNLNNSLRFIQTKKLSCSHKKGKTYHKSSVSSGSTLQSTIKPTVRRGFTKNKHHLSFYSTTPNSHKVYTYNNSSK